MNFEFSEEQTMIRDTLARLIRDDYRFDARHKAIESDSGWRPEFWAQLAELGILSASFAEDDGGFGGGPVETLVIMEEIGKGLVVEPFVPSVVCAGGFLKHAAERRRRRTSISPRSSTAAASSPSRMASRKAATTWRIWKQPRKRMAAIMC